jgi:ketosteroid isomerase-like protein
MSTRSIIQSYMDKMRDGDFVGAFEMFTTTGTYTIIGDTPVSKIFTGPEGIKAELVPLLGNGFKDLPVVNCTEIIAEGNRGVALGFGEGPGKYGTYRQKHYAFVFRVEGEQVSELVEFMDPTQLSVNCFGQTLSEPIAA